MGWSIKPGRGPSAFGAVHSGFAAVFGVLWTIFAINLTKDSPFTLAKIIFPLFGLVFIGMAIAQAAYHKRNATGENRFSAYDIVSPNAEPDPFDPKSSSNFESDPATSSAVSFCSACGHRFEMSDRFCASCGRPR